MYWVVYNQLLAMLKFFKFLLIILLSLIFSFGMCQDEDEKPKKKKKEQETEDVKLGKYHFQYHTIVKILPRDCKDSRTDQTLYGLNIAEEKALHGITISEQDETEVGEEVFKCIKQNAIFMYGEEFNRVKAIFNKMIPFLTRKKLKYEIFVIDVPFENAFACPGGRMYVTLPLLKKMNDNQLANIIGHEICHLEQKHCNVHLKYRKLMGNSLSSILNILTKGLGQRDELEADLGGLYLAYSAGYDPAVATEAFKRWSINDKPSFSDKIFRSHPYCAERVNCIDAYLKEAKRNADGLNSIQ